MRDVEVAAMRAVPQGDSKLLDSIQQRRCRWLTKFVQEFQNCDARSPKLVAKAASVDHGKHSRIGSPHAAC